MGLWDWIVGNQSEPSKKKVSSPAPTADDESKKSAVGTMDTPQKSEQAPAQETIAEEQIGEQPELPWWVSEEEGPTDLVDFPQPELTTEERALENALFDQFDGHDLDLPPFPRVPEKVLAHLRSRDCDFGKIAKDIAEDQVIVAAVIRMANSPLYRGLHKVAALKQAITRLGANALRTLMLNQSMRVATLAGSEADKELADSVIRRALASATIMRGLASFTTVDKEEAFLIGLLHDIGHVVVLREARRQHRFINYELTPEVFEYLCQETHQEFGELIAQSWALPPNIQTLIADHHRYPDPEDPLYKERLLLKATDMICSLLGFSTYINYDLLNSQAMIDLNLAKRQEVIDYLTHLPSEVDEIIEYL